METKDTLPDKLSALIRVGLVDVRRAEQDERYVVDMLYWHDQETDQHNGRCAVCMAGAVMAFSLGAAIDADLCPYDFGEGSPVRRKLRALDDVINGNVRAAISEVNGLAMEWPSVTMPRYEEGEAWFAEMNSLADELEDAGL